MAPKKSVAGESSSSSQLPYINKLIRDCNIPNNIQIKPLTPDEAERRKTSGLDDFSFLVESTLRRFVFLSIP